MGNPTQKSGNKKKQIRVAIWSVVGTLLLILGVAIGFIIYSNIRTTEEAKKTYPLGDSSKLEYVGQSGYGCWLMCDANPSRIYYYATDMSPVEVAKYFKGANLYQPIRDDLSSTRIWLIHDKQDFVLSYYTNGQEELDSTQIQKHIGHKYVVSLSADKYMLALSTL